MQPSFEGNLIDKAEYGGAANWIDVEAEGI